MSKPFIPGNNPVLGDLTRWTFGADPVLSRVAGRLRLDCRTNDPTILSPELDLPFTTAGMLILRMMACARERGVAGMQASAAVYYATSREPGLSESRCIRFPVQMDGAMHEYLVFLPYEETAGARLTRLRFDPLDTPGVCEVESFLLRPLDAVHVSTLGPVSGLRAANELHLRQQTARGSECCLGYPEPIVIPTLRCNAACLYCTNFSQFPHLRQDESLPLTAAKRVVEEMMPRVKKIYLSGGGEPLAAPAEIRDLLLSGLSKTGCLAELNTNGTLLGREMLERVYPVLDTLHVSLDAVNPETYARLRPSSFDLAGILANIRNFLEMRRARENTAGSRPKLVLSFTLLASNLGEAPDFVRLAGDLEAQAVIFRHLLLSGSDDPVARRTLHSLEKESLLHHRTASNHALIQARELCRQLKIDYLGPVLFHEKAASQAAADVRVRSSSCAGAPPNSSWCAEPWVRTLILADGTVKPCCTHGETPVMGDLNKLDFFSIWNGESYRRWRREIGTPRMPSACRTCFMRNATYYGIEDQAIARESLIR